MSRTIPIESIHMLQEVVRGHERVMPRGGGSKNALVAAPSDATILDMRALSGILEYQPGEYTFTALAGTPITQVEDALAENGQYLPFAPPFVAQGATLGGTIAAGLSGSARQRYGGVRDFLIGTRFVDGLGQLVRGGGRVVKNAAGFDLPKLMVGSLGRLGILAEVSFKVFPRPHAYATLRLDFSTLVDAVDALQRLATAPYDVEALDLAFGSAPSDASLYVRIGGLEKILTARLERLQRFIGTGRILTSRDETAFWDNSRSFAWIPPKTTLVKVPLTSGKIAQIEATLNDTGALRRYCAGGNLAWIAWPNALTELDALLRKLNLAGLVLLANGHDNGSESDRRSAQRIGARTGDLLAARIKSALDPNEKFLPLI